MKMLTRIFGMICFGATIYQSFVLFENFKSRDTIRKNSEVHILDNFTTPMIVVCSDPGNTTPEDTLIELDEAAYATGLIPRIKTFKTVYRVINNCLFCITY